MLAMILFILKIIGLVLLGILGLFLLLILSVLLVPVRYCADGSYDGKPKLCAKVSWFLHILSFRVQYDEEPDICVRVFGIRLKLFDRGEDLEEESRQEETQQENPMEDRFSEREIPTENNPQKQILQEKAQRECKEAGQRKKERKWHMTIQRICDKLKSVKQKKDEWTEFITREENQRTFRLILHQLRALIKHILPGKIEGRVRFGFDDPYRTGQILTYVSPFYGIYARHLDIIPVFDEPVLEGELRLKGRVRIGTVLVLAIRVCLDKNFRKLIGKLRKA